MPERPKDDEKLARPDVDIAKAALKGLDNPERAYLLAWLCKYFGDDGAMFSPQIARARRRRIVLDGVEYWLVQVPRPRKPS